MHEYLFFPLKMQCHYFKGKVHSCVHHRINEGKKCYIFNNIGLARSGHLGHVF